VNPLLDWLGSGGQPVVPELAQARASICETCVENRAPRWWEVVKDPVADCILELLEVKTAMNLRVENEEKVNMCRVCGCCIRLKVWVPIQHVSQNKEKFPEHCWIRRGE